MIQCQTNFSGAIQYLEQIALQIEGQVTVTGTEPTGHAFSQSGLLFSHVVAEKVTQRFNAFRSDRLKQQRFDRRYVAIPGDESVQTDTCCGGKENNLTAIFQVCGQRCGRDVEASNVYVFALQMQGSFCPADLKIQLAFQFC